MSMTRHPHAYWRERDPVRRATIKTLFLQSVEWQLATAADGYGVERVTRNGQSALRARGGQSVYVYGPGTGRTKRRAHLLAAEDKTQVRTQ